MEGGKGGQGGEEKALRELGTIKKTFSHLKGGEGEEKKVIKGRKKVHREGHLRGLAALLWMRV